ncbi:hypothetical protein KM043_006818 [Ampulex compressa]|nr:hypothetical protein KM043_006818 [Ampulex compressa]
MDIAVHCEVARSFGPKDRASPPGISIDAPVFLRGSYTRKGCAHQTGEMKFLRRQVCGIENFEGSRIVVLREFLVPWHTPRSHRAISRVLFVLDRDPKKNCGPLARRFTAISIMSRQASRPLSGIFPHSFLVRLFGNKLGSGAAYVDAQRREKVTDIIPRRAMEPKRGVKQIIPDFCTRWL